MGRESRFREKVERERATQEVDMATILTIHWKDQKQTTTELHVEKWLPDSQGRMLTMKFKDENGEMMMAVPFENMLYFTMRDIPKEPH